MYLYVPQRRINAVERLLTRCKIRRWNLSSYDSNNKDSLAFATQGTGFRLFRKVSDGVLLPVARPR
jgi:hypothetical protein